MWYNKNRARECFVNSQEIEKRPTGVVSQFLFFLFFLITIGVAAQEASEEKFRLLKEQVEMEDGVKLATDVYLPTEDGKYPVILVRTPYNKDHIKGAIPGYIERGYAVVSQDCRGKFLSEGEFYPFVNERRDGLKTVAWIEQQPWYNGKIGGQGSSYNGYTQWAVSDKLDVVLADMTGTNIYDLIYPNGLFSLETAFNWGLVVGAQIVNHIPPDKALKSYWHLPLSIADDSTVKDIPFINDWIRNEEDGQYWEKQNHQRHVSGDLLSIGGWYDIFALTQLEDFVKYDERNPDHKGKLVMGPWCHGPQGFKNEYGGNKVTGRRGELHNMFLDQALLGKTFDQMPGPFTDHTYNFFIMERNEYFGSETWPPKEMKPTAFYPGDAPLSSAGPQKKKGQAGYTYDPSDPFKSLGGTALGPAVGPALQNPNENRKDQLIFETEVLEKPLTLLGPVTSKLFVSSNVSETDFFVNLQDVFPDGNIINILEGGQTVNLQPGTGPVEVEIESWPTGYQVNPGHKLRVVITSSWFPRFNRNLNSGEGAFEGKDTVKAEQVLYYGKKWPSRIILPVVELD